MNDDVLKELLAEADSASVLPATDACRLSLAVRGRLQRRRHRIRTGLLTAAAVLVIAGIGSGLKYRSIRRERQIAARRQEVILAQIQADLNLRQLLLDEQQERWSRSDELVLDDPVRRIEEQVDETAFVLMYQAQRMAETYQDKQAALDLYQQVTKYFGQTQWADQAQEKIAQLQPNSI